MNFENKPATNTTPAIEFDDTKNILSIKGNSYPENSYDVYDFLLQWIKEHMETSLDTLQVDMEIIYMNSGTSKIFYDLFSLLSELKSSGKNIEVNWIFDTENSSAEENGEDYQEDFEDLDIQLVEKEDS